MVDKFPTKRKGSQSLRLTFLDIGNSSEPQFVPLLGRGGHRLRSGWIGVGVGYRYYLKVIMMILTFAV